MDCSVLSFYRLEGELPNTVIYAMSKEKGQQRAASSTFRVLAQAQHQTRTVAAKRVTLESRGFLF